MHSKAPLTEVMTLIDWPKHGISLHAEGLAACDQAGICAAFA